MENPIGWHVSASLFLLMLIIIAPATSWGSDIESLSRDAHWLALLHAPDGKPRIQSPEFLLSAQQFSPKAELIKTIELLFSVERTDADRISAVCQFPARYVWLQRNLNLDIDPIDVGASCSEIKEFYQKAPAHRISLVFASENLVSASSMMGHVLLKLSGDDGSKTVEHAISFFTAVDRINVPRLIVGTIITGQPGYYALSPYRPRLVAYMHDESRSVWEYELKLTKDERNLLLLHLHELRRVPMVYYFHHHNCATFTADLLSVVDPRIARNSGLWFSPLDVVKNATLYGLVDKATLLPSARWAVRMYAEAVNKRRQGEILSAIKKGNVWVPTSQESPSTAAAGLLFASSAASRMAELLPKDADQYLSLATAENQMLTANWSDVEVDLSHYKRPELSRQDAQVEATAAMNPTDKAMTLRLLPAGRMLDDDRQQSFGSSELRMLDTALAWTDSGRVRLQSLQVYSMISLLPVSPLGDGTSGWFETGYTRDWNPITEIEGRVGLSGGVGKSIEPTPNLLLYALGGAGAGHIEDDVWWASPILRVGAISSAIGRTKLLYEAQADFDAYGTGHHLFTQRITTLISLSDSWAILSQCSVLTYRTDTQFSGSLGIRRYF